MYGLIGTEEGSLLTNTPSVSFIILFDWARNVRKIFEIYGLYPRIEVVFGDFLCEFGGLSPLPMGSPPT